jgi:hypothetical protein
MIPLWKGKNPIFFGVITIIPFDLFFLYEKKIIFAQYFVKMINQLKQKEINRYILKQEMCASQNTPVYINYQTVIGSLPTLAT